MDNTLTHVAASYYFRLQKTTESNVCLLESNLTLARQ